VTKGHPAKKTRSHITPQLLRPELLQYPQIEKEVTWQWEAGYITQEPGCTEIFAGCGQAASHTCVSQVKSHLGKPMSHFRDNT